MNYRLGSNPDCPACNATAVMMHCVQHDGQILNSDGKPLTFTLDEDEGMVCCDFGELEVRLRPSTDEIIVWSMGETVMTMTPDAFRIEEGPWITTLASIRAMLDTRFGPVMVTEHAELH